MNRNVLAIVEGFIGTAWTSELICKRVPDGGSDDRECPTA